MVRVRVSEAFPLESYAGHAGTVLGETNGLLVIRIDGQPSFLALTLTAEYVNEMIEETRE